VETSAKRDQVVGPPTGPKATRTREILLATAKSIFLRKGYLETSIDEIAAAARVSRPTFYTYFRSKREVLEAIGLTASEAAEPLFDALGALGPVWTTDDIADWVRSYFAHQRAHGPWTLVWREAVMVDRSLTEPSLANLRHHAVKIGKHLVSLRRGGDMKPLHQGLVVLAILESLWAEVLRSPDTEQQLVDAASSTIGAFIRSGV
jgi:AcrR family transcriptional regulator